ncbi:hypothetical protein NC651_017112 [Populus alba x Populus x berolinensis]|nr:hypothetical protein NC651_017112 [Populus alba x Populus x berolinensis]
MFLVARHEHSTGKSSSLNTILPFLRVAGDPLPKNSIPTPTHISQLPPGAKHNLPNQPPSFQLSPPPIASHQNPRWQLLTAISMCLFSAHKMLKEKKLENVPVCVFGHCFILGGRFHQVQVDEQPRQWIRQVSFSGEAESPFAGTPEMLELWKWYQNCLAVHPVKKQVISSGFIWGFGDIAAKSITHYTAKKYNQIKGYRFIRSRLLMRLNSLRFVGSKVAIDGFLFGPLDLIVFFSYIGFATGKSVPLIRKDLKRDFIPTFVLEGARGRSLEAMVDISSPFQGARRSRWMISCLQDKKSQRVYRTSEEKSQVPNEALLESVFDTLNYI